MSVIRVGAVKIAGTQESHHGSGEEATLPYTDADVLDIPLPEHTYQRPLPPAASIAHCSTGCFGLPYQDHNYGMPPPPSPPRPATPSLPPSPLQVNGVVQMEEEVKTTPLAVSVVEEVVEDSITRCICGYLHDDGYMICCDKCSVWQHIDCMGVDRNNIPDSYFCEQCQPRILDAVQAKILQKRKREELAARNVLSDSSATDTDPEEATNAMASMGKKLPSGKKKSLKQKRNAKIKEKAQLKLKIGKNVIQNKRLAKTGKKEKENIKTNKSRKIFKTHCQKVKAVKSQSRALLSIDQAQQDPWNSSQSPWTDSYDHAHDNHYSSALNEYVSSLHPLSQSSQMSSAMTSELQVQLTTVAEVKKNRKGLKTTKDIPAGQAIIEYKGRVILRSELEDSLKMLQPFLLFYSKLDIELCVDARSYGNQARFIRRSCFPNAEVQHWFLHGEILFIIVSKEEIPSRTEITIPFDYDYKSCPFCVECACIKNNCAVSRHWKKLKNSLKNSAKDNNSAVNKKKRRISGDPSSGKKTLDSEASSPAGKSSPSKSPRREMKLSSSASSPNPLSPLPPKMSSPLKFSNVSTLLAASALLEGQLDVAKSLNFDMVDAMQRSPPPPTSPRQAAPKAVTSSRRSSRALLEEVKEEAPAVTAGNGIGATKEKHGKVKEQNKAKDNKDHHYHHSHQPVETKKERRLSRRQSQDESEPVVVTSDPSEQQGGQSTSESEEGHTPTECPRKMTREERKLDAIMKAFEKMEKRAERKKEAQARGDIGTRRDSKAKKKDDGDGNTDPSSSTSHQDCAPAEPDSGGAEDTAVKPEPTEQEGSTPSSPEIEDNETKPVKTEPSSEAAGSGDGSSPAAAGGSSPPSGGGGAGGGGGGGGGGCPSASEGPLPEQPRAVKEEPKPAVATPSTARPARRTGKRKRRRSRVHSHTPLVLDTGSSVSTEEGNSNSSLSLGPLSSVPSTPSATPQHTPLPPSAESTDSSDNFVFVKTKKHLYTEWSNKHFDENKQQETEMFVQCLPSPHVNTMDHLQRRNSHSAGCTNKGAAESSAAGSAKKRWLRQAMHEVPAPVAFRHSLSVSTELEHSLSSPAAGGSASPNPGGGQASPRAGSPLDFQTPLKKRRLMRESLGSESNGPLASPGAGVLAESLVPNNVAILPRSNGVKQIFPIHRHSTDDVRTNASYPN